MGVKLRAVAPPLAGLLTFLAALSAKVLNDSDTWWHVVAGRLMIDQRAVIHTDPFSCTFQGAPWHTHAWLAQVLPGRASHVGGGSGGGRRRRRRLVAAWCWDGAPSGSPPRPWRY